MAICSRSVGRWQTRWSSRWAHRCRYRERRPAARRRSHRSRRRRSSSERRPAARRRSHRSRRRRSSSERRPAARRGPHPTPKRKGSPPPPPAPPKGPARPPEGAPASAHACRSVAWLALPGAGYLMLVFALPLAVLLASSFHAPGGALSLAGYARFFSDGYNATVVWNTLKIAVLVTSVCLLIG